MASVKFRCRMQSILGVLTKSLRSLDECRSKATPGLTGRVPAPARGQEAAAVSEGTSTSGVAASRYRAALESRLWILVTAHRHTSLGHKFSFIYIFQA